MRRNVLSLLLAVVLCFGLAAPALAAGPTFSDVPAAYWGYEAIETMAAKGVISGIGNGLYAPDNQVTNVEFASMMVRLFYSDLELTNGIGNLWWSNYMYTSFGLGLLTGTPAGDSYTQTENTGRDLDYSLFEVPMPRAEMAQVIYNYLASIDQLPSEEDTQAARSRIPDYTSIPAKYQQAVAAVYASDYLSGVDNTGRFDGGSTLTRAQAAMVLCRLSDGVDQALSDRKEPNPNPPEEAPDLPEEQDPNLPEEAPDQAEDQDAGPSEEAPDQAEDQDAGPSEEAPDQAEDQDAGPSEEAPDQTEDPGPAAEATLANGKAITDENIREIIYGLQKDYPEGMHWTNDNYYQSDVLHRGGYGCEGFGLICSDAAFGNLPVSREHSDFDDVKVGDLLRVNHDTHTVIVLEKKQDSVVVAEGNYNSSIHWGREITRQSLEEGDFTVRTRYPAK